MLDNPAVSGYWHPLDICPQLGGMNLGGGGVTEGRVPRSIQTHSDALFSIIYLAIFSLPEIVQVPLNLIIPNFEN